MNEQKIDFQKWLANAAFDNDDEISDLAESYSKKLHVLTFNLDAKGENIVSQINGRIVFVERNFQYEVKINDTWVCSVKNAYNCSYATPIIRITPNDILYFNEQLRENVITTLWMKYQDNIRSTIENRFKAELQNKFADEMKKDFEEKLDRIVKEKDEIESELRQTRFQLESQSTAAPAVDDDFIILGSDDADCPEKHTRDARTQFMSLSSEASEERIPFQMPAGIQSAPGTPRPVPMIKRVGPIAQKYEVERIGPDSLRSPSFTDNRYFVHISPDYKVLVIRPNENGNVYCIDKIIRLKDLGLVSGFTAKKILVAEYSEQYEGMIVRL